MARTLYRDLTQAELSAEARALVTVLRTGTLPGSSVRNTVDTATIRARLGDVRQAIGSRTVGMR